MIYIDVSASILSKEEKNVQYLARLLVIIHLLLMSIRLALRDRKNLKLVGLRDRANQ